MMLKLNGCFVVPIASITSNPQRVIVMRIFAKIVLCISFMTLTACAAIELAPLPEGHPANSYAWVPREMTSATLAEPDPVDTAPARSDQWLKDPEIDKPHDHDQDHDQDGNKHDHDHHHHHDHGRP